MSGGEAGMNRDVEAVLQGLAAGLERLEERVGREEWVKWEWVVEAMELLRTVHAQVVALVEKEEVGHGEEWVERYMEETVKLVEVCNVVKAGMARLEQYRFLVDVVVRALDTDATIVKSQCYRALHALYVCKDEVVRMAVEHKRLVETKIDADGKLLLSVTDQHLMKWGGLWGVMFAVRNVNTFLGRLLLWVLVSAGNQPPFPAAFNLEALGFTSSWSTSLMHLNQRLSLEVDRKRTDKREFFTFFNDFELLQNSISSLILQLHPLTEGPSVLSQNDSDRLKQAAVALRSSSLSLHKALDTLDWHINDLFDDVVHGRATLVNLLTNVLS